MLMITLTHQYNKRARTYGPFDEIIVEVESSSYSGDRTELSCYRDGKLTVLDVTQFEKARIHAQPQAREGDRHDPD